MTILAYATVDDVQARILRTLSEDERNVCSALLDDAAVRIDTAAADAADEAKKVVSCRMIVRALGDGQSNGIPLGATQGSMAGLGYSQSWTIGSGGSMGELYLGREDRRLLGLGNAIGSRSPIENVGGACCKW